MVNLALIQYYFTGKEHSIDKPRHGNSKSTTPYKHTMPSTMNRIKMLANENGPVATVEMIDEEVGDVIGQHSAGERLRNVQQLSNARRHLNMGKVYSSQGSQLIEAMEMCKSGISGKNPFVCYAQAAPEPMCVLATDRQLNEMVRTCTDPSSYVPIGVDPTFKLGQFYTTPIVFPLKMLVCEENHLYTYLWPLLIHQSMEFCNYHYFASQLVGLCPDLKLLVQMVKALYMKHFVMFFPMLCI